MADNEEVKTDLEQKTEGAAPNSGSEKEAKELGTSIAKISLELASMMMAPSIVSIDIGELFSKKKQQERKDEEEVRRISLLKDLQSYSVDIDVYERHLTNEMNRRMKTQYGAFFLVLTILFTIASYMVVVLNAIYDWGISQVAVTALIIELPIQFIGILYIIARNLFPNHRDVN